VDKRQRRHFRRYKRRSQFDLVFDKRTFRAELIDYSGSGVGIIVESSLPVTEGAVLDLALSEPAIHTEGEIVWLKRSGKGIKIGIKKIGIFHGLLRDYILADVFIGLQRRKMTGILELRNDSLLKKVYIRDGEVIFSESNQSDDGIGEILLREGKISSKQYVHFKDVSKNTEKKHITLLVELGYLKPAELVWAVRRQSEEIIMSLFGMENGSFEFKECPVSDKVITLKLSPVNLIYKGINRISELHKLKKIENLLQLSDNSLMCFSSDPLNLFQSITLDDAGREVVSYIDGKTSIKDILLLSHHSEIETRKILYALLSTRIIDSKDSKSELKHTSDNPEEISAEDIIRKSKREIPQEIINKIETTYTTFLNAGYYKILALRESAPFDEIKRAYHKAVKEFHPDRYSYLDSEHLRHKLNTIFNFITEAYAILSDPEKKKQYDSQLSYKTVQKTSNNELAVIRFEEAIREFRNKNFTQASEFFGQAVYLDSSIAKYHYYYGLSLGKLKRYKDAGRALQKALKIDPINADCLAELGYVYLDLGFEARARNSFEKALRLSPSHKRAGEGMRYFMK